MDFIWDNLFILITIFFICWSSLVFILLILLAL